MKNIRFLRGLCAVLDILQPGVSENSRPVISTGKSVVKHTQVKKIDITQSSKIQSNRRQEGGSFLDLLASKLGLSFLEISPHDNLSDLGVDSLMSLT